MIAGQFLRQLIKVVPYKIHKVLTDNRLPFTNHKRHVHAWTHRFDRICQDNRIEHRFTKVNHPWTNGQVQRMNPTLKEATVHPFTYSTHQQLKQPLHAYLMAYNFSKRLTSLRGKTPWQFIQQQGTTQPELFIINPDLFSVGLNS